MRVDSPITGRGRKRRADLMPGVPNLTLNAVDYPAEQIGDESYVFTFSAGPAGVAGAICVFRLGNALFIVAGSGEPVTADDLVALARILAGRATG